MALIIRHCQTHRVNRLFYGDNLKILRRDIRDESVDLIYLDPPFNSNRSYNVLFKTKSGAAAQAQIEAFDDTWTWSQESDWQYGELITGGAPGKVADAIMAMRTLLGDNDVLAYLVMMTARLVELHRVLKPTGSLYLHCDPTASHYLKIMLDAIFGAENFCNEIIWKRSSAHSSAKRFGPVHDVIFYFAKNRGQHTWNPAFQPIPQGTEDAWYNNVEEGTGRRFNRADLTAPGVRTGQSASIWRGIDPSAKGRHWAIPGFVGDAVRGKSTLDALDALDSAGRIFWPKKVNGIPMLKRYLDESPGVPALDVITDISPLNNATAERLGYPTQKPVALLERIVAASSNSGDTVLDPFCGCGTTIDAAQKLGRRWVGIDITYLSIDLIQKRLADQYGEDIRGTYELAGVPREMEAAQAMFDANPFEFERWAVSLVGGQPNEKQVGDKGIDGVVRFHLDPQTIGHMLVSVKGGKQLNPAMVRDLGGTVNSRRAELGLFICLGPPTRGMLEEAAHSGTFHSEFNDITYPRVQLITISELLAGKKPRMPSAINPYKIARQRNGQLSLL